MDLLPVVDFLTGASPHNSEIRIFGNALAGAMAVRKGPNKDRTMNWFHAFALSTMIAFAGGWFGFLWMGKPTSLITGGDITLTACIVANVLVNATPFDIGFKILSSFPGVIVTTSLTQLFRCMGMISFITAGAKEIAPTPYYPTPVLGPVLWGCLLGNMGGFFANGFDGYLKNGIPWPFQNGIVVGTLFHLFAHDEEGFLGIFLRSSFHSLFGDVGLDDRTIAVLFTSIFMQFAGIVMLPEFMGPSWSPIAKPIEMMVAYFPAKLAAKPTPAAKSQKKKKKAA